jgi:hypothetical protein
MSNYLKYNDYGLYEIYELTNQDTYVDLNISINNNNRLENSNIIVLTSHELYSQTSNILIHSNVKEINNNNFTLYVTNKAVSGSGSNSNYDTSFSYLVFYNIENIANPFPYRINTHKLFYSGIGTISSPGYFDSIINYNDYCYFVTPRSDNSNYEEDNISLFYYRYDESNLPATVLGTYKDSDNGDNGGGAYYGKFCWLAIHTDISSNYTLNGNPIIEVGKGTTGSNGITTINHSFNSSNYIILLTPVLYDANTRSYSRRYYNVYYYEKQNTSFKVKGFHKDGRNGEDGGNIEPNLKFYWAVIKM